MTLQNYIDQYHQGNKSEFGRSIGKTRQGVIKMFNTQAEWIIIIQADRHVFAHVKAELIL